MPKNFEGKTSAIDKFLNRDEPEETETSKTSKKSKTSGISGMPRMPKTSKTPKPETAISDYPRICLRLAHDDIEYLKQASWERHQDMTTYLRNLIQADRAANSAKSRKKS
jgi:hypothetical protein